MRAVVVVVIAPCPDQVSGMAEAAAQVLVEAFVSQLSVEALDQAVLHRLARCDGSPCGRHRFEAHGGRHSTFRFSCHRNIAFEVGSVPSSLTTMHG